MATSSLVFGGVSGTSESIDCIVVACQNIPEVVRVERTSRHAARYYFSNEHDASDIARVIIAECERNWPDICAPAFDSILDWGMIEAVARGFDLRVGQLYQAVDDFKAGLNASTNED
jgi:hypothetical protein